MKIALLAMAAMVAAPALAQTTPQTMPDQTAPAPQDQSAMPAPPAPNTPPTAPSTPPTMTPDASMPAAPGSAPMGTDAAAAMPAPAPSATGKLPWCRAGQYTGCRERSNARGQGMRKN